METITKIRTQAAIENDLRWLEIRIERLHDKAAVSFNPEDFDHRIEELERQAEDLRDELDDLLQLEQEIDVLISPIPRYA